LLSDSEREEVFAAFAPEPEHRVYGRGIRRRLAPMLGHDQPRIRLALALMMALPGTPVLLYGDEIGMGEDLSLPGRLAVRNPMQWSPGPGGGFSASDQPYRPTHAEGPYGYRTVNVADQRHDPGSLYSWVAEAIRVRRESPELGWGTWRILDVGDPRVLAIETRWSPCTTCQPSQRSSGCRTTLTSPVRDSGCGRCSVTPTLRTAPARRSASAGTGSAGCASPADAWRRPGHTWMGIGIGAKRRGAFWRYWRASSAHSSGS
jgi:maltose alpha-D-glucosyltransferase/alpha-amylase